MGLYFEVTMTYKIDLLVDFILSPRYQLSMKSQLQPYTLDLQETVEPSLKHLFKVPLRSVENVKMNLTFIAQLRNDRKRT